MADCIFGLLQDCFSTIRFPMVRRQIQHPLTQPLPPILRIPLTKNTTNEQSNHHQNQARDQNEINSSLPHSITMMPPRYTQASQNPACSSLSSFPSVQNIFSRFPMILPL